MCAGVSLTLGTSCGCLVVLPHWFSSSDFGFVQPASHLSTGLWRHKEVLGTESLVRMNQARRRRESRLTASVAELKSGVLKATQGEMTGGTLVT